MSHRVIFSPQALEQLVELLGHICKLGTIQMGPDRLGFQKFVVFIAITLHHRDRADLNLITHTGSNQILKLDGARFLILFQHVLDRRLLICC